jgi:hypothetical protein
MARELESDFFRQEPWSDPDLRDLKLQFGVDRLQEVISRSMTDHIRGE